MDKRIRPDHHFLHPEGDKSADKKERSEIEQALADIALEFITRTKQHPDNKKIETPFYSPLILRTPSKARLRSGLREKRLSEAIKIRISDQQLIIDLREAIENLNGETEAMDMQSFKNTLVQDARPDLFDEATAYLQNDLTNFIREKYSQFTDIKILLTYEPTP